MAREIGQVDAGGFCCGCGDNDTAFEVFCEALEARRPSAGGFLLEAKYHRACSDGPTGPEKTEAAALHLLDVAADPGVPQHTNEARSLVNAVASRQDAIYANRASGGMGGNIEKYAPELEQGAALYPYLLSKCMRSRYAWAMERISESACTRVLEIGGYLTPLPSLETFGVTPHNVSLYVNVDLSARHAAVEQIPAGVHQTGPSSFAATLPLTLAEFEPFLATHVQQPFDCVLGLGLGT